MIGNMVSAWLAGRNNELCVKPRQESNLPRMTYDLAPGVSEEDKEKWVALSSHVDGVCHEEGRSIRAWSLDDYRALFWEILNNPLTVSFESMSLVTGRTATSIQSRLMKMGLLTIYSPGECLYPARPLDGRRSLTSYPIKRLHWARMAPKYKIKAKIHGIPVDLNPLLQEIGFEFIDNYVLPPKELRSERVRK